MKKIFLVSLGLILLAASCGKNSSSQGSDSNPNAGNPASVNSLSISPSRKSGESTLFSSGAVVKVEAANAQSVEIKYVTGVSGEPGYPEGKSLGQAASLSSQQNMWALPLPENFKAANLWAEAVGLDGKTVTGRGIGSVAFEKQSTYTSPTKYGFSIQYPEKFGFNTDIKKIQSLGYIPVCGQATVGCVFYSGDEYKGTNFSSAAVSVNVVTSLKTENDCYNFDVPTNPAKTPEGTATINGANFVSASGGEGAAGHQTKIQLYRNFHNNMCYEISQAIEWSNIGNYEPGSIKEFNQNEIWGRLQGIVGTFKFTGSAAVAPTPVIPAGSTGNQVTVTGTTVCLLHKNAQSGQPQTMECAIGLKEDGSGKYYGLKNTQPALFDVNKHIKATGTLSINPKTIYDVVGDIDVKSYSVVSAKLLQVCPDEWINNQMPGPGFVASDPGRQYYILNGERREISEFDAAWVSKNCNLKMQTVY